MTTESEQKEIIAMIQKQGWDKTVQEMARFMNQTTEEIESALKAYLAGSSNNTHRGAGRGNSSCP